MLLRDDTLYYYQKITNFNIKDLFERYVSFINNDKDKIIYYYSGKNKVADSIAFNNLTILLNDVEICLSFFRHYSSNFGNFVYWNLLEQIESIQQTLTSISNAPKFLRSNIYKGQFFLNKEQYLSLNYGGTLEKLQSKELFDLNFDNNWVQLAQNNKLTEEDYSSAGGIVLRATFPINRTQPILNSVLGSNTVFEDSGLTFQEYQQKQLYGIDLKRKFTFKNDDIEVLTPKDTIIQSIEILLNIKTGSVPQYLNEGISDKLYVGSNIGSVAFPSIFRQFSDIFSSDDTIDKIELTDTYLEQDSLFLEFQITTTLNEVIKINKSLSLQ